MEVCNKCGAEAQTHAKYCPQCGNSLGRRVCPNGHVMEVNWDSCKYCPSTVDMGATRVIKPTRVVTPLRAAGADHEGSKKKSLGTTQLYREAQREISPRLHGWLVITQGKELWRDYRITEGQFVLGRDKECDIFIDDDHVSSRHASLRFREGNMILTDLDSSNGTFVNGEQISRVELGDNTEIKIGDTVLKFRRF